MDTDQLIIVDKVKWLVNKRLRILGEIQPICPKHNMRLYPIAEYFDENTGRTIRQVSVSRRLKCEEANVHVLTIPRGYKAQQQYVIDKLDAKAFAQMKVLNIDDEAIPVAKEELKDSDYWVRAKVTESKSGLRLIVWAGQKSNKNKAQLFVEPSLKRMSFDQNDDHPTEVFAKVEATFVDGIKSVIKKD